MPLQKGDFVKIDYTGRIEETDTIFDTTIEEEAKKGGIYKEGGLYESMLVVTGEGWILEALDEKLSGLELGKNEIIRVPPEKGFGIRDSEKVKLYPLRKLTAKGITPRLGMHLEVDGKIAVVRTLGSGRALLDFNPPLAGKTLVYEICVKEKIVKEKEKILALIHRRIPNLDIEKVSLKRKGKNIEILIPEEGFYIEGLQISKRGIFSDLQKFFPHFGSVKFIEIFGKKEEIKLPSSKKNLRNNEHSL